MTVTSPTSFFGWAKIIVGGLAMVAGVAFGIVTHNWNTGLGIIGVGGTLAGLGSGAGLIAAQDATPPPVQPKP